MTFQICLRCWLIVLLVLFLFANCILPARDVAVGQADELQGSWQLVYQEVGGTKMPDEKMARLLKGQMVITGNQIHYTVMLPGFDLHFLYKLDYSQKPKAINLQMINPQDNYVLQKTMGIYQLKNDMLEICYSATQRPTNFTAGSSSDNILIVLHKSKSQ